MSCQPPFCFKVQFRIMVIKRNLSNGENKLGVMLEAFAVCVVCQFMSCCRGGEQERTLPIT